jgi:hypothetical protein
MEQLVIFILFVIGSIISARIQKKKALAEREARKSGAPTKAPPLPSETPVPHWPRGFQQWQAELKRILEEQLAPPPPPNVPPPVPNRPVIPAKQPARSPLKAERPAAFSPRPPRQERQVALPNPLRESVAAYSHAAQISKETAIRMRAVDQKTRHAKPEAVARIARATGPMIVQRWIKTPQSIREAFVASLVFGRPRSLEPLEQGAS